MTVEDLKNTKIYLSNEEDRIKFQEKVFRLGVEWSDGTTHVSNSLLKDIFFTINNDLRVYVDFGKVSFINNTSKQIFLDEVLAIEEPKEEHKFKPFDKVLMRDGRSPQWIPTLFACYYDSEKYPYMDITSILYSKCIPYEGNEHLVGSCKNHNK